MMQVALFQIPLSDGRALEELNRFLRGHRVLTLDREFKDGLWCFCVSYQPSYAEGSEPGDRTGAPKIDYKTVLDAPTFALFARLRELRKSLAEKELLPAFAVFTNEQLAEISRQRCSTVTQLGQIAGVGPSKVEKFGAAMIAAIAEHAKQPGNA